MGTLDVELSDGLIKDLHELAERHYGDASDDSVRRVVETALDMRLMWLEHVERAEAQVEEPAAQWEAFGTDPEDAGAVHEWLFEGSGGQ